MLHDLRFAGLWGDGCPFGLRKGVRGVGGEGGKKKNGKKCVFILLRESVLQTIEKFFEKSC